MKKKGFRFSFRTVACLTVLSNAALAAGADLPASERQPAVADGQTDKRAVMDQARHAKLMQDYLRAKRLAVEVGGGKSWLDYLRAWSPTLEGGGGKSWLSDATTDGLFPTDFQAFARPFGVTAPPITQPSATTATSGFASVAANTNYSTAGWTITAGDGTYPDLGGVATFSEQVAATPGTLPIFPTITLDVPVTLSGLTFSSVFLDTLVAGTNGALSLTTTGTNTLSVPLSVTNSPSVFLVGNVITAPIGGGGTYGLTKTGPGYVSLGGTNTYTGGTFVNGGTLRISNGDASLGATGAGNDVTINGGNLRVSGTALTTSRNFNIGTNNGTLELFAGATINGVLGGSGNLTTFNTGVLTLTAANTLTGSVTVLGFPTTVGGGAITLSGNGTLTTTSGIDLSGTLALSNTGTNVNNRLGSTVPVTSRGGSITLSGTNTAGTTTTENIGAYTAAAGNSILAVTPGTGGVSILAPASIGRQNNGTLLVRGASLGAAAAASVAQINPTTFASSNLVGGGGMAGSSTISIVPWMVGNTSPTAVTSSSFVTYTAATGLRPLATTEYATTITGATSTTNVRSTSAVTVPAGGISVNALLITSTAATSLSSTSGSVLTIASGALMYSPSSTGSTTFSANLNFGTAEGVISTSISTSALTLSGIISGSGGLTLNDFGNVTPLATTANLYISGTTNTYTGTTTLLNATSLFTGTISNDGVTPSAFGLSTTPIIINAGSNGARLYSTGAAGAVINRDLTIMGSSTAPVVIGTFNAFSLTLNGNVILNRPLTLEGSNNTATTGVIINGNISGTSFLTDSSSYFTYEVLNGNNTYSGGTNMNAGTWAAGSDTAFGTGTIFSGSANATGILGVGTATRTLANAFVFENGAVAFTFSGAAPLNLTGGMNLNGNTSLTFTNTATTTMSGVVANGSLTKLGAGTLALSNANTYTGGTAVSAGTLLVNNTTGSGTGAGAVNVTTSGTVLGGTGTIAGPVAIATSGAIIEGGIGSAPSGALTLNNSLSLASGTIIQLALSSTDGTHSSLARTGSGTWTFASGQNFTFTGGANSTFYDNIITGLAADPGGEGSWTITNGGFVGTFAYDGTGNIDLTISQVPEPATVLGGLVCVGLLGRHLRRRTKRPAGLS